MEGKRIDSLNKLDYILHYMSEWIDRQDEEERSGIVTGSRYDREHEQMWRFRCMCEEYRDIRSEIEEMIVEVTNA